MLAPGASLGHHGSVADREGGSRQPAREAGRLGRARGGVAVVGLGVLALLLRVETLRPPLDADSPQPSTSASIEARPPSAPAAATEARALTLPSGNPPRISCDDAKRVSAFVQRELAAPPIAPTPLELGEQWAGMLDPHGFWSAAPDSPLRDELSAAAPDMLESLFDQSASCAGVERVVRVWQPYLQRSLDAFESAFEAERSRGPRSPLEVFQLAAEPIFEDDPVTRPSVELARELGSRLGAFAARYPDEAASVDRARARFFPPSPDALREIAILAALRAYVPLIDPHGDFAPLDEEWALYAGDDTLDDGSLLWGDVTRTPLGARIIGDPAPPLEVDDLVLSINGLTLAGASVDQIEQAARSAPSEAGLTVRVLRQGEPQLLTVRVVEESPPAAAALLVERIGYGRDERAVLRVVIPDVGDDLGQALADALDDAGPGVGAVLLDLRGNGGGSLDAAVDSLGLFLPGAKLFPLIHRGAVTEVLEARRAEHPYLGPVAALVDGDTASAAEMLAGALQAYGRGKLIGARTFGKGCVQEYFDSVVPSGVLRMTTLQFVMPSGRPLQQIGLTPDLTLALSPALERESQITRQPITFDGPDVRDRAVEPGPAWPRESSAAGPCEDPVVCQAISRLAGTKTGAPGRVPGPGEAIARAARPRAATR
jgi:carboxyl-terminal processing protease